MNKTIFSSFLVSLALSIDLSANSTLNFKDHMLYYLTDSKNNTEIAVGPMSVAAGTYTITVSVPDKAPGMDTGCSVSATFVDNTSYDISSNVPFPSDSCVININKTENKK
ncbi:hypothetical protein Bealeia1_00448 [Candidatus Bealeia paramacronuclearis]|uniref:Uncharacterized protein n=1 Tax=Candidatus Bealeia paramacronuclearis TaxID=1921001 RepID=A0ABZ2C4B7_9PROT|nr:hypothetical protein [Candidatus Bealeia paramacronuclearis]